MFASKSLVEHLARGLIGLGAFVVATFLASDQPWLAVAALPIGLFALRGCPSCWLLGLVETVVFVQALVFARAAREQALLQKAALRVVPAQRERELEMSARGARLATPQFELGDCRRIEWVLGKPIAIDDGVQFGKSALGTITLADRDCAIERDDRGGGDVQQAIIGGHDRRPVSVLQRARADMNRRDRSLQVIRGKYDARGRTLEQTQSFGRELCVPARAILLAERVQIARGVDFFRQTRGMQAEQRGQGERCRCGGWRILEQ